MDCSRVRDLIPQYCSDELDAETRRQMDEHISGCSKCHDELKQEQELSRVISKSMADDPPEEYWDDYNAKVRSRARGVTGMLWRTGSIPGCLAGAFNGLVLGGLFILLYMGHGLRSIHPVWLKNSVVGLILVATLTALYFVGARALKKANLRVLPRYEKDETGLKQAIVAKPINRTVFIALRMTGYVGMSLFATLLLTGTWGLVRWLTPSWTVSVFRAVMLILFAAGIPAQYVSICDYMDGSHRLVEWGKRHRIYLRSLTVGFTLLGAAMLGVSIWQLTIMIR